MYKLLVSCTYTVGHTGCLSIQVYTYTVLVIPLVINRLYHWLSHCISPAYPQVIQVWWVLIPPPSESGCRVCIYVSRKKKLL